MKRMLTLLFAFASLFSVAACTDETPATSPPSAAAATTPPAEAPASDPDGDRMAKRGLPEAVAKKTVATHDNPTSITACFTRADAASLQATTFTSGDGCVLAVQLGEGAPAKYNIAASADERGLGQKDACCYVAPKDTP